METEEAAATRQQQSHQGHRKSWRTTLTKLKTTVGSPQIGTQSCIKNNLKIDRAQSHCMTRPCLPRTSPDQGGARTRLSSIRLG